MCWPEQSIGEEPAQSHEHGIRQYEENITQIVAEAQTVYFDKSGLPVVRHEMIALLPVCSARVFQWYLLFREMLLCMVSV